MIEKIIPICVIIITIIFGILFLPFLDYHYYCKDGSIIFTHISLYTLLKNKHPEDCKGFSGLDIEGQLNYINKKKGDSR